MLFYILQPNDIYKQIKDNCEMWKGNTISNLKGKENFFLNIV